MSSNNASTSNSIFFRTDASFEIGTGHVMRCLALAHELKQRGAEVVFVCRDHPGNLCNKISKEGFEVIRLPNMQLKKNNQQFSNVNFHSTLLNHASWLGADQKTDANQTIDLIKRGSLWNWLIVDHYAIDEHWESKMRCVVKKIMVIDDLADRKHDCDFLLDQNYFKDSYKRYSGLTPKKCKKLLGPKYALLRSEFGIAKKLCSMRGNGIARVLVFFGGNDTNNLTGRTLEALSSHELSYLFVEVVIGTNNKYLAKLKKQVENRHRTRLHIQPEGFVELMLRADFCIGAGGTTTWERLCLGLPSVIITLAENQESFTKELDKAGYVKWIGQGNNISSAQILEYLKIFLRNSLHKKPILLQNLVDGKGASRVTDQIFDYCK